MRMSIAPLFYKCCSVEVQNCPTLNVEEDSVEKIDGKRIIDINFFIQKIQGQGLEDHGPGTSCSFANMKIINETRYGFRSEFTFWCQMCHLLKRVSTVDTADETKMDLNIAAVAGTTCAGGAYSTLNTISDSLDIPCMTPATYAKINEEVNKAWEEVGSEEMKKAAAKEYKIAKRKGHVDENGVPLITVVVDGSWCKRSYRTGYSSLGGMVSHFSKFNKAIFQFDCQR